MTKQETVSRMFKAAFGDHMCDDLVSLNEMSKTTYAHHPILLGCLKPTSSDMITKAIGLATNLGISLAPISKGKNWGWGSCAPHADNAVLLDLSNMNKIVDYSDELGYITIQPGVSIKQVVAFLDEQSSTRMLPMGGTTPNASLIGHMCERGISVGTVYHDRASYVCGIEAILGNGKTIHTGMLRYGRSSTSATHRWGPGPSFESLLTQSDFGIITEATIWLPSAGCEGFIVMAVSNELGDLVTAFRDLESAGLRIATQIYNRDKIEKLFFKRAKPSGLALPDGKWITIAPVYPCSKHHAPADRAHINEVVSQYDSCTTLFLPLNDSMGPFNGRPYPNENVQFDMIYQHGEVQNGSDVNPERDQCGILWGCFAAPLDPKMVTKGCNIIETVIRSNGFNVFQAVHTLSERACLLFPQLSFPIEQAAKAQKTLEVLSLELHHAGIHPYRVPAGMNGIPESRDDHDTLIASVRSVFDPANVIAKRKYEVTLNQKDALKKATKDQMRVQSSFESASF